MEVLAKFVCESSNPVGGDQHDVTLMAVTSGSEENKSFSRWTPSANLQMLISDETPAATFFVPGNEYYLTFKKAE